MLRKRILDFPQKLDALLGIIKFALQDDCGAGELLDHLRLALVELILATAEFLQLAFLLLDHVLLALEREELILGALDLRVELFGGKVVAFREVK